VAQDTNTASVKKLISEFENVTKGVGKGIGIGIDGFTGTVSEGIDTVTSWFKKSPEESRTKAHTAKSASRRDDNTNVAEQAASLNLVVQVCLSYTAVILTLVASLSVFVAPFLLLLGESHNSRFAPLGWGSTAYLSPYATAEGYQEGHHGFTQSVQ
jgi:hypothetical protein